MYLFWERDSGRRAEGGRERIPGRFCAQPRAQGRAQCHHHEIMTWTKIKSQTLNWLSHLGAPDKLILKLTWMVSEHWIKHGIISRWPPKTNRTLYVNYASIINLKIKMNRGAWVAQSVKHLPSAQVMISWFMSSRPTLGSVPTGQSLLRILCPPRSAPPLHGHMGALSLSKIINEH